MKDEELSAIAHELKFWKGFVKTDRFTKDWMSDKKTGELHDNVYQFLKERPNASVLDIGSGAMSILKGTVDDLVYCDPLGELYECIFDYKGSEPPLAISGENLLNFFDEKQFDICHISNALDHCQHPNIVLRHMFDLAKDYVIVQGFANEADHEQKQGFHQWNIDIIDGELCIDKQIVGFNKPVMAEKKVLKNGKEWITWISKT